MILGSAARKSATLVSKVVAMPANHSEIHWRALDCQLDHVYQIRMDAGQTRLAAQ
ncbi:hypothetical protein [Achromobacter ruhlandii]|uniref:hypothetical protein n=1 Tax=Achromobacter ruhlandii TaxID=72557 RepID=UPI0022B8A7F9|nr:hypothetical protein [Achromobacter ruhlandii]MCZ8434533.1 hypothetical protein [Achromobacter ruhlandii]MDC6154299.1 hypothetical protein [Achromobacter ruhlandii]MDD7983087.1 hypothetical protein [Achromobacter ruhlandii]